MQVNSEFQPEPEAPPGLRPPRDFADVLEAGVSTTFDAGELDAFADDLSAQGVTLGAKPAPSLRPSPSLSQQDRGTSPGTSVLQDGDRFPLLQLGSRLDDMRRWLRELLSDDRVTRLGEPQYGYLDVPVILIGAPPVPEAEVTWTQTQAAAESRGLKITIGVLGFGKSVTTLREDSFSETATAGKNVQVLLKVPVMITAWERRVQANEAQPFITVDRIEWHKYPQRWVTRNDLPLEAVQQELEPGDIEDRTRASNARTGTSQELAGSSSTFALGLNATIGGVPFAKEISLEVTGSATSDVTWTLPGGYSFRRYAPSRGLGLIWSTTDSRSG